MAPVYARALLLATVFVISLCSLGRAWAKDTQKPLRVLFIGNSYTQFNNLPLMVRRIANGVDAARPIRTTKVTHNGATLRHQWNRGEARKAIERGGWDYVVLQPHSLDPFDRPEQARLYAKRFVDLVRNHDGKPLLFMPWARQPGHRIYRAAGGKRFKDPAQMLAANATFYRTLGETLGVPVVDVGSVWSRALSRNTRLPLYMADGTHPTQVGTFLAACVFYEALSGYDAHQSDYRPWPMSRKRARELKDAVTPSLSDATVHATH